jgi:DNA-binding MarR family transcriptional regulator
MDAVGYALKRGFHATLRCGRPVLARYGLTPARLDVLMALTDYRIAKTQAALRRALGVARATMSEMLASLEQLGWIKRTRNDYDRRTRDVALTPEGRGVFERAYEGAICSGVFPLAFDAALSECSADLNPFSRVDELLGWCGLVREFFGDPSIGELYPWHPDEYGDALRSID